MPHKTTELIERIMKAYFKSFHEMLFQTHTVEELLWGYEENSYKIIQAALKDFGIKLPDYQIGLFVGVS